MSLETRVAALKTYVASDGRVHPADWDRLRKSVRGLVDNFPPPLILGAAHHSDMAKRVRLIQQIDAASKNERSFERLEKVIYDLNPSEWICGTEPPSNLDSYGNEDTPAESYLLLMP